MAKRNIKKNSISTVIDGLHITVTINNIHIKDSYTVKKRVNMRIILDTLEKYLQDSSVTMDTPFNHRSINSMVNEWIAHNNLYILGYKAERVAHLDLNWPQKWHVKVAYWLLSIIVL